MKLVKCTQSVDGKRGRYHCQQLSIIYIYIQTQSKVTACESITGCVWEQVYMKPQMYQLVLFIYYLLLSRARSTQAQTKHRL